MRWCTRIVPVLLLAGLAATLGLDAEAGRKEVELADAEVFIEWNSTDTDFGIQFNWDGAGWTKMKVKNERKKTVLSVKTSKGIKAQSLTEAAFESREPPAEELSREEFFERFPEGTYTFSGKTFAGDKLVGEADFSHTLAAPTTITAPLGGTTQSSAGFRITFTEVTEDTEGEDITVEAYTVVLETTGEDPAVELQLTLPPGRTSVDIPGEFVTSDTTYKVEVIAQDEESGNRTITETGEFSTN